jgi:hypothetical protein
MSSQGSLFNTDTSGVNLAFMWFGQIVDETTWVQNHAREDGLHSLRTRDNFQGYGYRYKVRIFGRELEEKNDEKTTKDEELYMAEVSMPVTSGSGHAGSVQTPNLRQGNYVFGFYKDGIEATEPIIFGTLPNHAQTRLFGNDPDKGFVPRTGGNGLGGAKQFGNKNMLGEGPDGDNPLSESAGGNYVLDARDIDIAKEQRTHYLPKTYECDVRGGGALKGILKVIQDIQAFVTKVKTAFDTFAGQVSDVLTGLNSLIQDAALLIADYMKGIIDKMRGFAENLLNKFVVLPLQSLIPPNLTSGNNEIMELILDILACIFNKLIKGLFSAILNLLTSLVNKILGGVDAALCSAQSFMSILLGGILGPITQGLSAITSVVNGVLGSVSGIINGVFNALSAILGIIAFLTCDEDADCSAGDGWSFWYGDGSFDFKLPDLSGLIKSASFSGIGVNSCNTKPKLAEPPKVKFIGGGGIGAIANAIISDSGDILGFDIIDGGSGYTSSPTVLLDNGGPGSGAVLYARLEDDETFFGGAGGDTSRAPKNELDDENFKDTTTKASVLKINAKPIDNQFYDLLPEGAKESGIGEDLLYSGSNVNIGGSGGTPLTVCTINSNNLLEHRGKLLTIGPTSDGDYVCIGGPGQPIITTAGPLLWNSVGGTKVTVGGDGGDVLVTSREMDNSTSGKVIQVIIDKPLFNINDINIIKGPYEGLFTGRGNYDKGSFQGAGTIVFKDENDKELSLEGRFSGFDNNLTGKGTGTFVGTGIIRNATFAGEGIFAADKVNYPVDDNDNNEEFNEDISSKSGDKVIVNDDGTGTIESGNNQKVAVSFVKVGAIGGSPVIANGVQATIDGNPVTTGGRGGSILLIKENINPGEKVLKVNDAVVTVGPYKVTTGGVGVPLVVGGNQGNSEALVGDVPLTSSGSTVTSSFDVGSQSNGNTGSGTFSGPGGSSVQEIIVVDSGTGYLNRPDGSIYSNGVKISDRDGTIVLTPNIGYNFYRPNTAVNVNTGDLVFLPPGTDVGVYDNFGNELQRFNGLGLEEGILIESPGTLTTPTYDPGNIKDGITGADTNYPSSSDGSYPAVLKINDILIGNSGINYSPEDKIDIQPSNGTVLEPVFNNFGKLITVNIVNPGIGFLERPKITLKSNTGINAIIIPVFGVQRFGDLSETQDTIPEGAKLIEVIDCVGKIKRS